MAIFKFLFPDKPKFKHKLLKFALLLVPIIVFMVVVSMSKEKILKAQIPQPAPEAGR